MNVCSAMEPRSVITGVSYRNRASFGRLLSPDTPYGPRNDTKSSGWSIFPTHHAATRSSRFAPVLGISFGIGHGWAWFPRSRPVRGGLLGKPRRWTTTLSRGFGRRIRVFGESG